MEDKNTSEPQCYSEYDNLKGMVIHSTPLSKKKLTLRMYSIFSLFFQNLKETDLEEIHVGEHCGAEEYFGTT
jgi:hypothetical protein